MWDAVRLGCTAAAFAPRLAPMPPQVPVQLLGSDCAAVDEMGPIGGAGARSSRLGQAARLLGNRFGSLLMSKAARSEV
jgi:hypothetical protein